MKFRLIYPVLFATALVALPSCNDDSDPSKPQPAGQPAATQSEQKQSAAASEQPAEATPAEVSDPAQATEQTGSTDTPAPEPQPADTEQPQEQPTDVQPEPVNPDPTPADTDPLPEPVSQDTPSVDQVNAVVLPLLADATQLTPGETTVSAEAQEDGSYIVTATTKLTAKEDMVRTCPLSEAMDGIRKGINEMANKAMQPDSLYLLQIGANASEISEQDRAAKPMPENLKAMADELKELSDVQVGIITVKANEEAATVTTTMKGTLADGKWTLTDAQLDRKPLEGISTSIPASDIQEGVKTIPADFMQNMEKKVAAFNDAAKEYILGREETARALHTEKQALVEETLRKAEANAAAKGENEKIAKKLIFNGANFNGEWKRATRFGTIALQITEIYNFDESIQFTGNLYDPKLTEASMDITGRCEFAPDADGNMVVDVEVYDGQYDPNKPTAEVFDSSDSMLRLTLSPDGKLKGIMSCRSWGLDSPKAFSVDLKADKVDADAPDEPIPGVTD